jgi:hypothetical protein
MGAGPVQVIAQPAPGCPAITDLAVMSVDGVRFSGVKAGPPTVILGMSIYPEPVCLPRPERDMFAEALAQWQAQLDPALRR